MSDPSANSANDKPYLIPFDELAENLSVDPNKGLSDQEAGSRLKQYGKNKLKEHKKRSIWQILLSQIQSPVIYLLAGAAILAG
ncbi:MAG: cation-transporting P-type ATPase [Bacteroidales bacterium]